MSKSPQQETSTWLTSNIYLSLLLTHSPLSSLCYVEPWSPTKLWQAIPLPPLPPSSLSLTQVLSLSLLLYLFLFLLPYLFLYLSLPSTHHHDHLTFQASRGLSLNTCRWSWTKRCQSSWGQLRSLWNAAVGGGGPWQRQCSNASLRPLLTVNLGANKFLSSSSS